MDNKDITSCIGFSKQDFNSSTVSTSNYVSALHFAVHFEVPPDLSFHIFVTTLTTRICNHDARFKIKIISRFIIIGLTTYRDGSECKEHAKNFEIFIILY